MKEEKLPKEWEEAIDRIAEEIREEIDEETIFQILEEIEKEKLQKLMETDDGIRPLADEEINFRMYRVNGDVICKKCGKSYYKHPDETRILGYDGHPFLKRLCNGWLGKL